MHIAWNWISLIELIQTCVIFLHLRSISQVAAIFVWSTLVRDQTNVGSLKLATCRILFTTEATRTMPLPSGVISQSASQATMSYTHLCTLQTGSYFGLFVVVLTPFLLAKKTVSLPSRREGWSHSVPDYLGTRALSGCQADEWLP